MKHVKCRLALVMAFMMAFTGVGQMPDQRISAMAAVVPDDSVSLNYVSTVDADTADSVLRVYGDEGTTYDVPININADCTVLLDSVKMNADLTIATGVNATVVLRGNCRVGNVVAVGGSKTVVNICGEDGNGTLTTGHIAYGTGASKGVNNQTGANVNISNCTVICSTLGVGGNGSAWTEGTYPAACGAAGGSSSPIVNIENATVSVSGSIGCGGAGSATTGYYSVNSGAGGNAGEVHIKNSYVSVSGSVACGGAGSGTNMGYLGGSYSDAGNSAPVTIDGSNVTVKGSMAIGGRGSDGEAWGYNGSVSAYAGGASKAASNVTITNGSQVLVEGNVSTAQVRSAYNSQAGLNGGVVTVSDSALTANDIASGSVGGITSYGGGTGGVYTYGSAGGSGGSLIASNAVISCKSAVNGANASNGSYGYSSGASGTYYYSDGKGGYVNLSNTVLNITGKVGQRGATNAGNEYKGEYSDSYIVGGTVQGGGTVYGGVITTDLTSYIGVELVAGTDIRNTEEASVAKCTLHTNEDMAGKTVQVTANNLSAENVTLDGEGNWITYLAVGKETIKVKGDGIFSGTYMVKRSASLNEFALDPYGILDMTYDSADIYGDHYEYTGETYDYIGAYHVRGTSETSDLIIHEGMQSLTATDVTMDVLSIKGDSDVTIELNGVNRIKRIDVEPGAKLTLRGSGTLNADKVGNANGSVGTIIFESGTFDVGELGSADGSGDISLGEDATIDIGDLNSNLKDASGTSLYKVTFVMGKSGIFDVSIGDEDEQIILAEGENCFTKLLAEGTYEVVISKGLLKYRGIISVHSSQSMYLDDLELFVDISDGDVVIKDGSIQIGEQEYETDADIRLTQSGEKHTVTIEKKDAVVTIDGVDQDIQIYLPDDFNGMIEDVSGAPVQLVTIHTPYQNQVVNLVLDEKEYSIITNEDGDFTILAGCTNHTIRMEINDIEYQADGLVRVSASNNSFSLDDFSCVVDLSKGDFTITEDGFVISDLDHDFHGNYIVTQTQETKGMLIVLGGNANISLDQTVDSNVQICVSEEYTGSITADGMNVSGVKIETPYKNQSVTVTIGTEVREYDTDANGNIYAVVSPGTYEITFEGEDGAVYTATVTVGTGYNNEAALKDFHGEKLVIVDGIKYRYPIIDGVMGEAQMIGPEVQINGDVDVIEGERAEIKIDATPSIAGNGLSYEWYKEETLIYQSDESKSEEPEEKEGAQPEKPEASVVIDESVMTINPVSLEDAGTYTVIVRETNGAWTKESFVLSVSEKKVEEPEQPVQKPDDNPSSGNEAGNSSGLETGGGSSNTSSGEETSGSDTIQEPSSDDQQTIISENEKVKPTIKLFSNLKGLKLKKIGSKNLYRLKKKGNLKLKVQVPKGCKVYYKIVVKGKKSKDVKWKNLKKKILTIQPSSKWKRVYFKVAGSEKKVICRKTTGFLVVKKTKR